MPQSGKDSEPGKKDCWEWADRERKGTLLQPMFFLSGEGKINGAARSKSFPLPMWHPSVHPSVRRVSTHLSLVITVWNYSRVQRDETRGIIRSAHIACVAGFVCFDKPCRASWDSQKVPKSSHARYQTSTGFYALGL